jgi:hypothetical protein
VRNAVKGDSAIRIQPGSRRLIPAVNGIRFHSLNHRKRPAYLWWQRARGEEKDSGLQTWGKLDLREDGTRSRKLSVRLISRTYPP